MNKNFQSNSNEYEGSLWGDGNVLKLDCGKECKTM